MASAVGRGRGRGRGLYTIPAKRPGEVTSQQNSTEVRVENVQDRRGNSTDLEDIKRIIDNFQAEGNNELLIQRAKKYAINEETLVKLVELICEKTFKEPEFGRVAAKICEKLCEVNFENEMSFRKSLLRTTQEYFKDRESFHKRSIKEWVGLVSFICQLFNVLRINQQPLKPLAVPIYQMLNELLRGRNFDEINCLHKQLKEIGPLLDTVDQEKMSDLYMKMRILLVDYETPEFTRLLLLELIELRSGKWVMRKENEQYFVESRKELLANAHAV